MRQSRAGFRSLVLVALALSAVPGAAVASSGKYVLGWIEQVRLLSHDRVLDAKLDTGAQTSSLDARQIKEFARDEEEWVSFVVPGRDGKDDIRIESEIFRRVEIIQQDGEQEEPRVVVKLHICIAGAAHNVQFTLANREAFDEQVLVGRRLLRKLALVDASEKFLSEPVCSGT